MLTPRLFLRRATRTLRRGGFTLVELLVVIGIIAILAGVALGPITNGIKKAKQSSGVQESHAIGLAMYSAANDNSQLYPDSTSNNAANVAQALLGGNYVSDPGIFWISGDTAAGSTKFSGTSAATNIATTNVSWDFLGNGGSGASSVNYVNMPLLWSTVNGGTEPSAGIKAAAGTVITAVPTTTNPFSTDGVVVFYINNSANFVLSSGTPSFTVTMVSTANNTSGGAATYVVNQGL